MYFCNFSMLFAQSFYFAVLDASGNYFGGYFNGNNLRPIDPTQCMHLNEEINELTADFNETKLPFYVQVVSVKYRLNGNSYDVGFL